MVVGGLPADHSENYVFEYDEQFRFQKKHVLPSGQTRLGIHTAAHFADHWWFGCYGSPANPGLLKADDTLRLVGQPPADFSFGIVELEENALLRGECFENSRRGRAVVEAIPRP